MKRQSPPFRFLRPIAGISCFILLYFTAAASFPYLEPLLGQAAAISAGIAFPSGKSPSGYTVKNITSTPTAFTDAVDTQPLSSALPDSEPIAESPTESTAETAAPLLQKPQNAGELRRRYYPPGDTAAYAMDGLIKNCTSHTIADIEQVAAQQPAFSILANGEPEVLIMHTHATESYQFQPVDWFDKEYSCRTTDLTQNVCRIGDEIQKQLEACGIGVLHDKTLHDYPSYNGAYERSAATVKAYLQEHPTIKVVLDVHRDAIQPDSSTIIAPVTEIDGRSCAQIMIISGCDDGTMNMPNYFENLKLSAALQRNMSADYPTLARPILFDYRKYNQNLTTGSILLEVGGHANTLQEAIYCGELVGKSLAKTLLALKQ